MVEPAVKESSEAIIPEINYSRGHMRGYVLGTLVGVAIGVVSNWFADKVLSKSPDLEVRVEAAEYDDPNLSHRNITINGTSYDVVVATWPNVRGRMVMWNLADTRPISRRKELLDYNEDGIVDLGSGDDPVLRQFSNQALYDFALAKK